MNTDIHVFPTRDGQWKARIERTGEKPPRIYTRKHKTISSLMIEVQRHLILSQPDT